MIVLKIPTTLRHWLKRRQKHYRKAKEEYCFDLRAACEKDIERQVRKLNARSIVISLDCCSQLDGPIKGLKVDRSSLPGVKLNERVLLVDKRNERPVKGGYVVEVGPKIVKVMLNEPVEVSKLLSSDTKEDEERNKRKEERGGEEEREEKEEEEGKKDEGAYEDKDDKQEESKEEKEPRLFELNFNRSPIFERHARIDNALHRFKIDACSVETQKCLLGQYNDKKNVRYNKSRFIIQPQLRPLPKGSQVLAIEQALRSRIALIEGVAGSGKTLVAANLACSSISLRKKRILLCSPIQATVDRLAEMLRKVESIKLVQLTDFNVRKDRLSKSDKNHHLDVLVERSIYSRAWIKMQSSKIIDRYAREDPVELRKQAKRLVRNCSSWLKQKTQRDILLKADVVCCTLVQAGNKCLKGIPFDMLIIDDAHLTNEIDCLIAMMVKGVKQVTLLSEMRRDIRLPRPSLLITSNNFNSQGRRHGSVSIKPSLYASSRERTRSKERIKAERGRARCRNNFNYTKIHNDSKRMLIKPERCSRENQELAKFNRKQQAPTAIGGFFERLLSIGLSSAILKNQYRMHETLAEFPKYQFYMSRLKTDIEANEYLSNQLEHLTNMTDDSHESSKFDWLPNKCCITAIFNANSEQSINHLVEDVMEKMINLENIDPSNIALLTNTTQTKSKMTPGYDIFDAATVEDYLGQERDFVIMSCFNCHDNTRNSSLDSSDGSYNELNINYLQNNNALNLALTRARIGLIIVADLSDFSINEKDVAEESQELHRKYCKSWIELVKYYQRNKLIVSS